MKTRVSLRYLVNDCRFGVYVASFIGSSDTNKYIIKVFTDKHAFLLFHHREGQSLIGAIARYKS